MNNTIKDAPNNSRTLLDAESVAALFGCSVRHIHRLVARGGMPQPVRLGALIRWNRQALESWIDEGCPQIHE